MTAPFTTRTDANGEITFRGSYGQYEVTQRLPGKNTLPGPST